MRRIEIRKPLQLATTVAAVVLVIAGCGGGGGMPVLDGWSPDAKSGDTPSSDSSDPEVKVELPEDNGQAGDVLPGETQPTDTQIQDVKQPGGCCESAGDCPAGQVCLGLEIGTPGTCWPEPPAGFCFYDEDCAADEVCLGEHVTICVMSSLPIEGTCWLAPDTCCMTDADCEPGTTVCQGAGDSPDGPGECVPIPPQGECWTDWQCDFGEHCEGALTCGCMYDCYAMNPGVCVSDDECCKTNEDCPPNHYCVGGNIGAGGVCWDELLEDGACFEDDDCYGEEICKDAQVCSCDMNCPSVPGYCWDLGWNCCYLDAHCPQGFVCAGEGPGGYPGSCEPPAPTGACWDNDDCPAVEHCEGAQICPCDALCDMIDLPGSCVPDLPGGCCQEDADCVADNVCAGDEDPWNDGICLVAPAFGDCWDDGDCGQGEWCFGSTFCPCNWDCDMDMMEAPGFCVDPPWPCCFSEVDCPKDMVCAGDEFDWFEGGICKEPPAEGNCWDDGDCETGETCFGAIFCPCGTDCGQIEMPGACLPSSGDDCCGKDADCPDGHECVDVYPDFGLPGACKPKPVEGMCWQHGDCAADEVCLGAVPCPCGWDGEGDGCDIPGTCQSKAQTGCCTVDGDCPAGYECGLWSTCTKILEFGECWTGKDCYATQHCSGASICPCGTTCIITGTYPGECKPLPASCCYSDGDCGEGLVCRAQDPIVDLMPGSCVPDPNGPGCPFDAACCWNDGDCGPDKTCTDAYLCGCNELCIWCGDCMEFKIGFCK